MIWQIFTYDKKYRFLKIQIWWRHGGHFFIFPTGHSHGRNFTSIFFKFEHKMQSCSLLFAIENQRNRLRTFDVIRKQKSQNFR